MFDINKKIIRILLHTRRRPFLSRETKISKIVKTAPGYKIYSFGVKNRDKIFYVIKRYKGGGLFSNLLFVLNHLILAEKLGAIPVVDMENFTNLYSEKNKIKGTKNSWLYYFAPVSKYSLNQVYKSKFVVFSSDKLFINQAVSSKTNTIQLEKVFKKYIKIKPEYLKLSNNFIKKNFKGKKILGVHWRGTDHKVLPNHPYPPTQKQIFEKTDYFLNKYKFDKIFLITEELNYLNAFKKKYKNKLCYFNSFRAIDRQELAINNRKNHRYNLGRDSLVETLIMSNANFLICSRSNISEFANFFSKKKRLKSYEIFNGFNSPKILNSLFMWKIKNILPYKFGGFK